MKFKVDEWVYYCPLPDVEYFKNNMRPSIVLAVLNDDLFYDYRIYVDETGKIKKVREHQLFSMPQPT
jgi:hypothetical protein